MDIKKIVLLTIVLMIAVSSLSVICATAVSAADDDTIDTQHGIKFKIPDGYKIADEDTGISDYSVNCTNDNGDSFTIKLKQTYSDETKLFGDSAEIAGVEGTLREYSNGMVGFFYTDDNYLIEIHAPDESTIEQIITEG